MTWCPAVAMSGLGLEYRGAEGSQLTGDQEDTALDSLLTAMPGCLPAESYSPRQLSITRTGEFRGRYVRSGTVSPLSNTMPPDDNRHTLAYGWTVKLFRWAHAKNEWLKAQRGVSFEEVVLAIEANGPRDVLEHPNAARYPRQRIFVVALESYAYLVPFVTEDDHYFLKTIIPSRKATRKYIESGDENG